MRSMILDMLLKLRRREVWLHTKNGAEGQQAEEHKKLA